MDDITARIMIAVQSGEALQNIEKVRAGIEKITAARQKDMNLIRKYADMLKAERRGADEATAAWKRLQQARNGAGGKAGARNWTDTRFGEDWGRDWTRPIATTHKSVREAAKGMREFSASATAARAAGRLFGIDVGEGVNPALIKQGIIVAGVVSSLKVAGEVYSWFGEKARYASELAMMNYESVKEVADQNSKLWGTQQAALGSLENLQQNERLTYTQRYKMSQLLKELQIDYRKYGFEIDSVTGKIKNFASFRANIEEYMTNKQKEDIKRARRELIKTREKLTKEMDDAGVKLNNPWLNAIPAWWLVRGGVWVKDQFTGGHTDRLGGGETIEKGQKKLKELSKQDQAFAEQSRQLANRDPAREAAAAMKDRAAALGRLITQENQQYQIQLRRIQGDERGAAWLQKELELRKRIKDLKIDELEQYQKNWEKNYDYRISLEHQERLKSLGKELEIENLLIAGDERRARLAKWQNELEKQGLKPEQLKAEMAAREQLHQTQQFRQSWSALESRINQMPMTRFRETAQSAVMADSLEAIRLQSRVAMQNPEMKILNEQLKILKDVKQVLSQMNQKGSTLTVWTP